MTGLPAEPEKLRPVDVQELLERLENLQEGADGRKETRLGAAKTAFSSAVQSDGAALELYLKCVEKVRYEDADRSSQAFREWKRRNKDRMEEDFQRALRHELNWLLLTIEAASAPDKREELGPKAMEKLDQMVRDLALMGRHKERLNESVLKSVFATTYGLAGIELEDWPLAPLKVADVYHKLIFPPLRKPGKVAQLKEAWSKRIEQEGLLIAPVNGERNGLGGRREEPPARLEVFLTERRPILIWQMEVDLFKAGDERGAAVRMVEHIKRHLGHKSEGKWIEEFKALIEGEENAPVAAE